MKKKIYKSVNYWRKEEDYSFGISDYFILTFDENDTLIQCVKIIGARNININLMFPDDQIIDVTGY
jgi:hypothetical protein